MVWRSAPLVLLFAATVANVSATDSGSNAAIQKVIAMLEDMRNKAKQEKQDEEVAFAKFSTWCSLEQKKKKDEIADGAETIASLEAEIGKLTSDVKQLGEEIAKLQSDVENASQQSKDATAQRKKDNDAYLAEVKDYSESVDALDRAIQVMKKQDYDRTGKAVLLQLTEQVSFPAQAKEMVAALIGMDSKSDDPTSYEAPEANAYEFQSGGIIELLKKLRADFAEKKGQCEKEEMNSVHAYNMIIQDLTDTIENGKEDIEEKTADKAKKQARIGQAKKDKAATEASKAEDEATLKDMETECTQKTLSFEEKQKLREGEIAAISKAIEILSSNDVAGNAAKHLAAASFLQVGSRNSGMNQVEGVHRRVREFLESEGSRLHSKGLQLLAQKLIADPFAKVKKLIDDMITRLLNEANDDANHEGWCDTEMGKSKITRNKLTETIDGLDAAVEEGKARILSLGNEITKLNEEIADIDTAVKEATALRTEEKAKNKQTIEESQAAQKAVAAATAVLKDFYAKAAQATAFIQGRPRPRMGTEEWKALANPNYEGLKGGSWDANGFDDQSAGSGAGKVDKGHTDGMQTFGDTYQGNQDAAGGVLALLEVALSDFANLEADTSAAESSNEKSHVEFLRESKKDKSVKTRKAEMNAQDKSAAEVQLREDVADLKATQDELLAADRYHAKLVPQCIDQGMTWEERVAARESEIASLKKALEILSGSDIA